RLARWRSAVRAASLPASGHVSAAGGVTAGGGTAAAGGTASGGTAVPAAGPVLDAVRERLADDLDAPGALAAIDAWAAAVLSAAGAPAAGPAAEEATLIRDTADALLGIAL
ncbi:MAG: hypothetical protein J2P26_14495, partial [Nocardiopsaceae bacterium]|nr:hypothetical protein [Nocardiopsaceae bacterium]